MYRFCCKSSTILFFLQQPFCSLQQPDLLQDRFNSWVVKRPTSLFKSFGSNVAKRKSKLHLPVLTYLNGVAWLLCSFLNEHFFFFFRDILYLQPILWTLFKNHVWTLRVTDLKTPFSFTHLPSHFHQCAQTHISTFRSCFRSLPQVSCSSVVERPDL